MDKQKQKDSKLNRQLIKAVVDGLGSIGDLSGQTATAFDTAKVMGAASQHETMVGPKTAQKSAMEIAREKAKALNDVLETGYDEHQKEKKRRLEQFQKESSTTDAARKKGISDKDRIEVVKKQQDLQKKLQDNASKFKQNKEGIQTLEKKQSDFERQKKETEKKYKENMARITQKKNERLCQRT